MKDLPNIGIVIPCFNENEVLPDTLDKLIVLFTSLTQKGLISLDSKIYCVDDGSTDNTWDIVKSYSLKNSTISGFRLAGNKGHQNALLAGLENASGDALISLDADLQDDISVIEQMILKYKEGTDIVFGVRSSRELDSSFKKYTAQGYYKLLETLGVKIIYNHADYRLMSRRTLEALKQYKEVNLFLRGIIPDLGFKKDYVYFERGERLAGESKYPIKKMLALALDGITSFSSVPLRMISLLGISIFIASLIVSVWAMYSHFINQTTVPGWTSSVLPMYLLGGIQLLSTGVIGEYLAKTYMETKLRPRYIIMEECDEREEK